MSEFEVPEKSKSNEERVTGLIIAVIAVILSFCSAAGNKCDNDEIIAQVSASNQWAYFQAKKMRDFNLELGSNELQVSRLSANAEQSKKIDDLLAKYESEMARYKAEGEEIKKEAQASTLEAEKVGRRGNYFDMAEVVLQLAIVLCSLSVIIDQKIFLKFGIVMSALGVGVMIFAFVG